ncbi:MAG: phosphoribosylformylglycinamidine synthase I [Elusimicrobiota bacterium]|jgi:phosphoribosylformylglycinamidine synthase
MSVIKALVLRTAGTNCDQETAEALRLAGAQPEILHIHQLFSGVRSLEEFQLLVIPGGFSYGDDVGAGKILANELRFRLGPAMDKFIAEGKRVIGICNGFQVLVKTGFLPGGSGGLQTATLASNDSGEFQCHWVRLKREKSACRWLNTTAISWELPIAHGEGKFIPLDAKTLATLERKGQVVFRYDGSNPNGSVHAIAGICNPQGNVVGLMPHPERHAVRTQHPEWTRRMDTGKEAPVGLQFFQAAVRAEGKI